MKRKQWRYHYIDLYTFIVGKYGSHSKWETKFYPSKDKKKIYEGDLEKFSMDRGFSSGGARAQVNWAITTEEHIKPSHVNVFLDNKKYAFKCGFITAEEIH